jgi:hypothetical protein
VISGLKTCDVRNAARLATRSFRKQAVEHTTMMATKSFASRVFPMALRLFS